MKSSGRSDVAFSWKDEGILSPVGQQGSCGSCWAFAAAGAIDAAYNIKNPGQNIQVSPQHFLNCPTVKGEGCAGGDPTNVFKFAKSDGACLESDIPYEQIQKKCDPSKCKQVIKIKDYLSIDKDDIFKAVKDIAPVSITMHINKDFLFYESGPYNAPCGINSNHAMLLVGYGVDKKSGHKYWIVKNSWGTDWGEDGYLKVSRSTSQGDNYCRFVDRGLVAII